MPRDAHFRSETAPSTGTDIARRLQDIVLFVLKFRDRTSAVGKITKSW